MWQPAPSFEQSFYNASLFFDPQNPLIFKNKSCESHYIRNDLKSLTFFCVLAVFKTHADPMPDSPFPLDVPLKKIQQNAENHVHRRIFTD